MTSNHPVDFGVLEDQKENVLPLKEGYSARALASTFQQGGPIQVRTQLTSQREGFEQKLQDVDEEDDPLEAYLDYIKWTNNSYPSGATTESGLVQLLERCTCKFRDEPIYKDDPRFLRVWMQYIRFSDTPKDVFMYLSKKEIGKNLAAYYEEYASYLEVSGRPTQANEVFEAGIQIGARPLERLKRKYGEFCERLASNPSSAPDTNRSNSPVLSTVRPALMALDSVSGGISTETASVSSAPSHAGRPKLQIFSDPNGAQSVSGPSGSNWASLGSTAQRKKENVMAAKPWQGEKLEMSADYVPKHSRPPAVYREAPAPGKRPERIGVALQYLVDENGEELCLYEMLAITRGLLHKQFPRSDAYQAAIVDDSPPSPVKRPASPTMTAFTKAAMDDVLEMFNQPLDAGSGNSSDSDGIEVDDQDEDEDDDEDDEDEDDTINEGMNTDSDDELCSQANSHSNHRQASINNLIHKTDELSVNEQNKKQLQSNRRRVNPMTDDTRQAFKQHLKSFLRDKGYFEFESRFHRIRSIKEALPFSPTNNNMARAGQMHVLRFPGHDHEMYSLRRAVGVGGYGYVYLAESSLGELKAVKIEPTDMAWEYYMLKTAEERLRGDRDYNSVVHASKAFTSLDETYTVMEFMPQGTSLDMRLIGSNMFEGVGIPEVVVVFFAIQLLRSIDTLHRNHIIHGDLKPDNVMTRIDPSAITSKKYNRNGDFGWSKQGITFIDFGRAIDLELFETDIEFISDWKTDNEDCIEMREGRPWTYQADYHGIAGILYTLLFGQKIQTIEEKDDLGNRHFRPSQSFKRYWQKELWIKLFDVLLNPTLYCAQRQVNMPLSQVLTDRRIELESWLEENSETSSYSLWKCLHDLQFTLHVK